MEKPYIIGIAGGSGSGKTTFIKNIRKQFSDSELCIISMDDYYLPRDQQPIGKDDQINFDLPKSFNKKEMNQDLQRLLAGETIEKEEYLFNNPSAKPTVKYFKPAPIIIIEGLFVFHFKKVAPLLDMKIFFYVQENIKVIRRIKRDQTERGYPIEDVLYKYEHHVMPSYKKYIEPYMESCDIIVNNNKSFELGLEVLTAFIQKKLK
jgi:uridine kinase